MEFDTLAGVTRKGSTVPFASRIQLSIPPPIVKKASAPSGEKEVGTVNRTASSVGSKSTSTSLLESARFQ